jgi:protocatechuate 4,5-dioxygenase beta chain
MANIVGGFLIPHDPLILSAPQMAEPEQSAAVHKAFSDVADRARALQPDTVVVIGDDHFTNFGPHCIPRYLIAVGDVEGPVEEWLGPKRRAIPNNAPLANHIMTSGFDEGIDWAFAKSLTVDHSIMVPFELVVSSLPGIKTIPVYLNSAVEPVLSSARSRDIGDSIRRAVESWPGDERVVIIGTGGISHWVGDAQMGRVNVEFDQRILKMVSDGDIDALVALKDEEVLLEGGNGCLEIRNWICAMAAVPHGTVEVLAYEPVPQWICGLGFVDLGLAA